MSAVLVANARMYSVEPMSAAAWEALLAWVARQAGVDMAYEPHRAPAPLDALWRRPDLGCALMCGYPFATWHDRAVVRPYLLAAVVPSNAHDGRPVYRTAIVTRADGGIADVEGLRGCRFGYTTPESQSGYQAVRHWAGARAAAAGGRWFGETVGPLVTPRAVVDAILRGDADAGPLDGYWLDLCSAAVPPPARQRIAGALLAAADAPELADVRATLGLASIASVEPADYATLAERARDADALGYPALQ